MEDPTQRPLGLLFDIDSTLLATGGASTRSWAWAFERLHGVPVEVEKFAEPGMTDPRIARVLHEGALGRPPSPQELAAGAVAVGVATGHYTVSDLRAAGADHALENLEHGLPGLPLPLVPLTASVEGRTL